ncbi:MAG: hypothetical protein IPL84_14170 [Chitinophagaceae bacterium]|nr:hypothetical protein [Chitinophagaceae bacterium]
MDKKMKLQILIDQQQNAIEELNRSMGDFRDDADLDEGNTLDPEDFSHQTIAKESQLRLKQQLAKARADMELLQQYAATNCHTVETGALVQTNTDWFLIGISLGGYQSGDINLRCISADSPAFRELLGKKTQDSFSLGNNNYTILAIN